MNFYHITITRYNLYGIEAKTEEEASKKAQEQFEKKFGVAPADSGCDFVNINTDLVEEDRYSDGEDEEDE